MSLENEINRLKRAKSNIRASLKTKIGLDIPEETKLDEYAKCIDDVESTCPHINGDFYSIRTNNGTNYYYLFSNYTGNNLDLSKWDTSKVTDMSYMFFSCSNLTSLDLSNFDTSKVTNMSNMFYGCSNLTSLDVSNFDTSKVTNMTYMFQNCYNFTSLDLSHFDTSKVTNMGSMFQYCYRLVTLDLSGWDTSKVTNMNSIFYNHSDMALTHIFGELDLSNLTNGFNAASYADPLKGCTKLETLYLKNIYKNCNMTNSSKWCINLGDTNVKDECLIYIIDQLPDLINDKKLTTTNNIILTLPKTNLLSEEQVAVAIDKGWKVANTTYNLASYNVVYDLENVTCEEKLIAKEGMPFKLSLSITNDNYAIESVIVTMGDTKITPTYTKDSGDFNISASINITSVTGDIIITATAKEVIRYTSFTVGVSDPSKNNALNISNTISNSVKKILINGKSQILPTGTSSKRYTIEDGDEIQISGKFNIYGSKITSISNFELQSNVTNVVYMFGSCSSLTSLDLSNLDTSKVTNIDSMFRECKALTSLDLSNLDTSNVTNMGFMFYNCSSLTSLDLSSFDTRKVTSYDLMLANVPSTCVIYINPLTFINKSTGKTFTPRELSWYGTFTERIVVNPIIPPIDPTDPNKPLPPA